MAGAARVAVVGYGLGGSVFHAPLISATPRLELRAIVTSNPERREAARDRYPDTTLLGDVTELLRAPGDLDVVVITTPNTTHFPLAEAVVSAGVTAVVDKPVTPTRAEAERLAQLAHDRGVSVIPYHNRRWDGDFMTVRDSIASGRLGGVWRFESRFERWRPGPPRPGSWKSDPDQAGGGVLYDLGSHLVDQVVHLFGPPASVYAELLRHTSALDDDAFVALSYPDGPAVHLWASTSAARLGARFRVLGSERGYVKHGMDPQEDALRAGSVPGDKGFGAEPPEAWGTLGLDGESEAVPTRPGAYQEFYAGVARHLLDGAPPPVDIGDAVAGLRILEGAERSARSGAVVSL